MKTYIVPLMILNAPMWWKNFIHACTHGYRNDYKIDGRVPTIKEFMHIKYNATLLRNRVDSDSSILTFNCESLHLLFMLEWS